MAGPGARSANWGQYGVDWDHTVTGEGDIDRYVIATLGLDLIGLGSYSNMGGDID